MSAHTPGPWAVHPVKAQVDAFSPHPIPVCQMLWPTTERSEDETEANARLIAAAPDLFREAKLVFDRDLTIVGNEVHIRFDSHADACTAVAGNRAAIKKAEGGE